MNAARAAAVCLAAVSIVTAGCTAVDDTPPPGSAASVDEVAERLADRLVDRDGHYFAAPPPPCGSWEDGHGNVEWWPRDLPKFTGLLEYEQYTDDPIRITAVVWPDESDAERVIRDYEAAVDDCDHTYNIPHLFDSEAEHTGQVAPGWQGTRTTVTGYYDNESAIWGDYAADIRHARKGALMVALKWTRIDPDGDHTQQVAAAMDEVLASLGEPSSAGADTLTDPEALSQRIHAGLPGPDRYHPDMAEVHYPAVSLACDDTWPINTDDGGNWPVTLEFPNTIELARSWSSGPENSGDGSPAFDYLPADTVTVNELINVAADADRAAQLQARYPDTLDVPKMSCNRHPSCDTPSKIQTTQDYTENGWQGRILTSGAQCDEAPDASVGSSVVDLVAHVHNGPVTVYIRAQSGAAGDLDATADRLAALVIETIAAIPAQ